MKKLKLFNFFIVTLLIASSCMKEHNYSTGKKDWPFLVDKERYTSDLETKYNPESTKFINRIDNTYKGYLAKKNGEKLLDSTLSFSDAFWNLETTMNFYFADIYSEREDFSYETRFYTIQIHSIGTSDFYVQESQVFDIMNMAIIDMYNIKEVDQNLFFFDFFVEEIDLINMEIQLGCNLSFFKPSANEKNLEYSNVPVILDFNNQTPEPFLPGESYRACWHTQLVGGTVVYQYENSARWALARKLNPNTQTQIYPCNNGNGHVVYTNISNNTFIGYSGAYNQQNGVLWGNNIHYILQHHELNHYLDKAVMCLTTFLLPSIQFPRVPLSCGYSTLNSSYQPYWCWAALFVWSGTYNCIPSSQTKP